MLVCHWKIVFLLIKKKIEVLNTLKVNSITLVVFSDSKLALKKLLSTSIQNIKMIVSVLFLYSCFKIYRTSITFSY